MTALTTLPFLTVPSGEASLTAAVTTSPRPAFLPRPPPRGRITCNLRAPELSATSSIVLICTDIVVLLATYSGDTAGAHAPCLNLVDARSYLASAATAAADFSSANASDERRTITSSDQRFSFDRGRASRMRTTSPK